MKTHTFEKQSLTPLALAIRASILGLGVMHGATYAAEIIVDSNTDDGIGCTLREAIESANTLSSLDNDCAIGSNGTDNISFSSDLLNSSRIILTEGELSVFNKDIEINAGDISDGITVDANNNSSVFFASSATLSIDNLTLSGGSANLGGGIRAIDSNVTLTSSDVSGNTADNGGGIHADTSTVRILDSIVSNNNADNGGGIRAAESNVFLQNSTVSNNTADYGGGLQGFMSPTLTITSSTFFDNVANENGGGVLLDSSYLTVANSTFSNNSAVQGGGFYSYESSSNFNNVTFSDNEATEGGGLYGYSNVTYVNNSIIANSIGTDCNGYNNTVVLDRFSIVEDASCDAVEQEALVGDPGLLELADNGGSSLSHAITESSLARDGANQTSCETDDQTGQTRSEEDEFCDIGAVEFIVDGDGGTNPDSEDTIFFVIPLPNGRVAVIPL